MATVTKRVYGTCSNTSIAAKKRLTSDSCTHHYNSMGPDGTGQLGYWVEVKALGSFVDAATGYSRSTYINFDTSKIKAATSAKIVYTKRGAGTNITDTNVISSANFRHTVSDSELGVYYNDNFSEGTSEINLDTEGIDAINNDNSASLELSVSVTNPKRTYTGGTGWVFNPTGLSNGNAEASCSVTLSESSTAHYIEYTYEAPDINSFSVDNTHLNKPVTCVFSISNADSWVVQAIKDGVVVASKSGTTGTSCTFNPTELPIGEVIFRITATSSVTEASNSKDISKTITAPEPTATNVVVNQLCIDEPIIVTATATNNDTWVVQAIQNGSIKATKEGVGSNISATFAVGELRSAVSTNFRVVVKNTWHSNNVDEIVTLTRKEPKIIALEPSNVNANKDVAITCSWTTHNQQSFKLAFDNNVYEGTTQTSIVIPANTIKSLGTKTITLTITYTSSWGEVRTATKAVTFNAVGTPNTPILDGYSFYSTANPTFAWTCLDDFTQYRVQVYKGQELVDDSNDMVSSIGSYTCQSALENNTSYTVKVKIKTQYGYWSEWASKDFITNFVVANKPSIEVFISDNSVIINSFTVYSEAFDYCDIYRKTEYGEWVRIAHNLDNNVSFMDEYVGKEGYYYKVTSVSTAGGKNDSDEARASVDIKNFNFSNLEDLDTVVEFIYDPDVTITTCRATSETLYDGVYAPVVDVGEQNYRRGSCSFLAEKSKINQFLNIINKAKVMMYRDGRGEKIFCHVVGDISPKKFTKDWYNISFEFVEVPFIEKDMYIGNGNQSLVFWDGAWRWDGTITWDGEGTLANG